MYARRGASRIRAGNRMAGNEALGSRSGRSDKTLLAGGFAMIAAGALVVPAAWASHATPARASTTVMAQRGTALTAAELSGQLVSISGSGLTIRSQGGQNGQEATVTQTIGTTAATRYYTVQAASVQAMTVGASVAISPMQSASGTAASVTLVAPGGPIVYVQQGGPGGFGGPGGPPPGGGAPPGGGPPLGGGQGGPDDAAVPSLNVAGAITARSSTSLTVRTTQGKTETLTINAATKAYRVVAIARRQLRPQSFVTLSARLVDGRVTARDVVTAPSGTMVTIFTPGKAII